MGLEGIGNILAAYRIDLTARESTWPNPMITVSSNNQTIGVILDFIRHLLIGFICEPADMYTVYNKQGQKASGLPFPYKRTISRVMDFGNNRGPWPFDEYQREPISSVCPYSMPDSKRTKNHAAGRHRNGFLAYYDGPLSRDDIEDFILAGMLVGNGCLSWFVTNQFGNHVFRSDQLFPDLFHRRKFQLLHDLQMFHCGLPTGDRLSSPYNFYTTFYISMSSKELLPVLLKPPIQKCSRPRAFHSNGSRQR